MSVFISVHRSWRARSSRRWWSSCLAGGVLVDHVPHVCTLPPLQEKSQCPSCCAVIVKTQYKTIIIVDYFESSLFIWAINLILEENWVISEGRGIQLHCYKYKLTKPGSGGFLATPMLKQVLNSAIECLQEQEL